MRFIILKYLITASLVVLISEIAKRSDKLGALVASLPLVTLLTLFWLYIEGASKSSIANHAYYTFWYVVPTLPMFLAFPYLLSRFNFWLAILISILLAVACFIVFALVVKRFGIELL
ncbi:MAG: DUF3147 family protein [Burkholderiales bacterium]|jgi:uncharacterized membrane protein (GlpM family)|nr:DUF3147 family protein [Burkholderiales bacterium]MCX7205938.1 DUF3147 family protein [Pseudomonadota bacterium]